MWILATVLGIILFLVLLLSIPVDLTFRIERDTNFRSMVRLEWMFGLIGKGLERGGKKKERAKKKRKKKGRARKFKPFLAMLRTRGFLRNFLKYLRDVIRRFHIQKLKLVIRFGLTDPADTGFLLAVLTPAIVVTNSFSSFDAQLSPDFECEMVQGYFQGGIRVFPIQIVWCSLRFFLSWTTIRAVKSMVMAR